jgi:hypothetical protein
MATITVPGISIGATIPPVDIFQSCILFSPDQIDPIDPGDGAEQPSGDGTIWAPLPPGVTEPPATPGYTIVDTSPDQLIGCIFDASQNPQGRLNILFPSAIEGDGVVERITNDIWVLRSGVWENVGPTPGPTIVEAVVLPPYIETVVFTATSVNSMLITGEQGWEELEAEFTAATTNENEFARIGSLSVLDAVSLEATVNDPTVTTRAVIRPPVVAYLISAGAARRPELIKRTPLVTAAVRAIPPFRAGNSKAVPRRIINVTASDPTVQTEKAVFPPPSSISVDPGTVRVMAGYDDNALGLLSLTEFDLAITP